MKTIYFDCFAGASGDMIVGCLIDLGLDPETLRQELGKLPVSGFRLEFGRANKRGVQAARFAVFLEEGAATRLADSEYQEVERPDPVDREAHNHEPHDHEAHHHHHGHTDNHAHPEYAYTHSEHPTRHLSEILEIIALSTLSERVKRTATQIFTRLGQAEARVHGGTLESVHLHEVGGIDAIVDICAAAIGLEQLGVEQVVVSPLHLGSGFVRSAHGLLPVPAPATAYLLEGAPVYSSEVRGELVTPTGAAILTTVASGYGPMPALQVTATGYGAGTRERAFPNVLRGFIGDSLGERWAQSQGERPAQVGTSPRAPHPEQHAAPVGPGGYHEGPAVVLEANIDDMNPQFYEHLTSRLLQAGALDVLLLPAQMKKNRPGVLLHVLAHPDSVEELLGIIFVESTTIGVRTYPVTKRMLQRSSEEVETPYGRVRVKLARLGERVVNVAPEHEDCRALAERSGVAIKDVYAAAQRAQLSWVGK